MTSMTKNWCIGPGISLMVWVLIMAAACQQAGNSPSVAAISAIHLKRGEITVCGAPDKQFGKVAFQTSCSAKVRDDFDLGIALLHSFEYDEAEKAFAKVIDAEPGCAMAYWGVAMCNNHPLWTPPSELELEKGAKAISIARSLTAKTKRESGYIDALNLFYQGRDKADHHTRSVRFERAMEKVYHDNPTDKEAAIFYALALDGSADAKDQSFANQKKAGAILFGLYPGQPEHPGIIHYIIHTYDYPGLARLALPAARRYAAVAPSSAHAQHMPSHIFTRLGLWDDCIRSNLASVASARCYAPAAGIQGTWDEELHGLDYLVYAYLQKGENKTADSLANYLNTISVVYPVDFKDAYAFAAVPSRYVLENKLWVKAARLKIHPEDFPWKKFPWQKAMVNYTRLLGFVHQGEIDSANSELKHLNGLHQELLREKDAYKATQVEIQLTGSEGWILFKKGRREEGFKKLYLAADMEDHSEKHPVTPCELLPAREQLGDVLMEMGRPAEALKAYEADLARHPNRFNGLYGAAVAAQKSDDRPKAARYYRQLLAIANGRESARAELSAAQKFVLSK